MECVATLTLNPAVDLMVEVDRVVPTHKLRCGALRRDAGGGGINVARTIHRLGGRVVAIFPIGRTPGDWLAERLADEGVPAVTVPIEGETREDFTALETSTGLQYRFVLPGPVLSTGEFQACLDAVATLSPAPAFVVASGSLPEGVGVDAYACVARTARRMGAKIALDTHGPALGAALDEGLWLIKPSLAELQGLTGLALPDEHAQIRACRELVEAAKVELVALTLGDRGAILVGREQVLRAGALPILPASAIGAGDSFLGGLVCALAEGRPVESAFACAVAAASASLLHPGTELCQAADVERFAQQVKIEVVNTR